MDVRREARTIVQGAGGMFVRLRRRPAFVIDFIRDGAKGLGASRSKLLDPAPVTQVDASPYCNA